ncbi:Myb-like DNA-binding domain [Musa troglodytarum]|uniref:Myb-like DNA-binding domain n=1 Tax=Musa troglodytarum TaxID=320322 RepID=A0A9E7K0K5_9LILI|nr:Myb-like DNA-binding domain [Musa troglodytarum]
MPWPSSTKTPPTGGKGWRRLSPARRRGRWKTITGIC